MTERPLTTNELLSKVHVLPHGSGKSPQLKATDLSPVTLASIKENLKYKTVNTENQAQEKI